MSPAAVDVQSWGSWAIQVEEIAGIRIHRDIVDEAVDAWQEGVLPQVFAERMLAEHCDADANFDPFDLEPKAAESTVLLAFVVLVMAGMLGWALAPTLQRFFL